MIPGFIISWITFPGIIVHELAHALFCRLFGVDIYEVKFFQFATGWGQPSGYVLHGPVDSPSKHVLIAVGPFFVNSILGGIIGAPAAIPILRFNDLDPVGIVLIWLGVSIAMHAFPSTGDAKSISNMLKQPSTPLWTKLWATPIVWLIHIGALASIVWADLLWGLVVVGTPTYLLTKVLA